MSEEPEKQDSESEEEEDDVIDDAEFERSMAPASRGRQSVSAEAYGEWNKKKAFTPPVYEKSEDQKERLKTVLSGSFMFSRLEPNEFNIIIGAMQEVAVEPSTRIITRGDNGDTLYVIETGVFDCSIPIEGQEEWKVVKTCRTGDVFGELALLYNAPRAATVTATEAGTCWSLDRETFSHIVKEAAQNKRNRYDTFLAKVPLLASMDPYERSQLADALRVETATDGQTIVIQGEVGDKFYIVEEGACVANKDGAEVMQYGVGDYFGELALIRNTARAATVVAQGGPAKLLSIDGVTFKRLLDVSELEKKAEGMYK